MGQCLVLQTPSWDLLTALLTLSPALSGSHGSMPFINFVRPNPGLRVDSVRT